jgi:putative ATPase
MLAAAEEVRATGALPVPLHLRNAPTLLMKDLGYGRDYRSPHDAPGAIGTQDYLPERLRGHRFYEPADRGHEKTIRERLAAWRAKRPRT